MFDIETYENCRDSASVETRNIRYTYFFLKHRTCKYLILHCLKTKQNKKYCDWSRDVCLSLINEETKVETEQFFFRIFFAVFSFLFSLQWSSDDIFVSHVLRHIINFKNKHADEQSPRESFYEISRCRLLRQWTEDLCISLTKR